MARKTEAPDGNCPGADTALRYLAGDLRDRAEGLERHIDTCGECRGLFAELARTSLAVVRPSPSDAGPVPLGDFLPVGTRVDRYRITGLLGRGGMGVVYDAEDLELVRPVALKVLHRELSDAAQTRLLAEARASSQLSHPNVRGVFHIGVVEERLYLVLERIDGQSLARWLERHPRSVTEIVEVFRAAGEGLVATHAIGVVHRDFKPANVLVDVSGRVVVCDFGLATAVADAEAVGGTPRYMAPEQRAGGGDTRIDQYAFAVSLRDALEGRRVPRQLVRLIERAGSAEPEHRFADMRALLDALPRPGRSRLLPIAGVGVAGLALAVAAFAGGETTVDAPPPPVEAVAENPSVDPRVQALLDVSSAYGQVGDFAGMSLIADLAYDDAQALGDEVGTVVAMEHRARSVLFRDDTLAIERGKETFFAAVELGRNDIGAQAAIDIIPAFARLGKAKEALAWGRHAEGKLGNLEALEPEKRMQFERAMGLAFISAGELPEAVVRLDRGAAIAREASPPRQGSLYKMLTELGTVHRALGDLELAHERSAESVAIAASIHGTDHIEYAHVLAYHALIVGARGDRGQALDKLVEAQRIARAAGAEAREVLRVIEPAIGIQMLELGRFDEAREQLRRVIVTLDAKDPTGCPLRLKIGEAYRAEGRCDEATTEFRAALDCWEALMGPQTKYSAVAQRALDSCAEGGAETGR